MLRERIVEKSLVGANCSQVILLAAAEEYGFALPQEVLDACKGISGGFGIQGMCSGIVAAVMVLGLLFTEEEVKEKRILFLVRIQERLGALDCGRLSAKRVECVELLEEIAEVLEEIAEAGIG